jgi:hypothetical protein
LDPSDFKNLVLKNLTIVESHSNKLDLSGFQHSPNHLCISKYCIKPLIVNYARDIYIYTYYLYLY